MAGFNSPADSINTDVAGGLANLRAAAEQLQRCKALFDTYTEAEMLTMFSMTSADYILNKAIVNGADLVWRAATTGNAAITLGDIPLNALERFTKSK